MRVFFSFYYTADHVRARRVMQDFIGHPDTDATGLIPAEELADMAQAGLPAIYAWIEREVSAADAIVVLIGAQTRGRHFVEYELACAQRLQKPLIGVAVNALEDADGRAAGPGDSPLFPVVKPSPERPPDLLFVGVSASPDLRVSPELPN